MTMERAGRVMGVLRRRPHLALFALAAAARVAWAIYLTGRHPELTQFPDSRSYVDPAHSLLDDGRFDAAADEPGRPMVFRTPGYPVFIAMVQLLFGRTIAPVLVAQGLVGALVAPMAYDLSRRLGLSGRSAGWAGLIAAHDPLSIVASGFLLTETLAQVTTVAAVWVLVRLVTDHDWRLGLGAGVSMAASLMIRPGVYYLLPPLVLLVVWVLRRAERRRLLVACFALPLVLTTGAWHVRNHVVADFGSFSAIEHVNLGLWRGVGVERRELGGEAEVRPLQMATAIEAGRRAGSHTADGELLLLGRTPDDVDQAEYYDELRALGLERLRSRPDLALQDMLTGAAVLAVDVDETRLGLSGLTTHPALEALLQSGLVVLYTLAVVGATAVGRRHRPELLLIGLTVAYVLGTSLGPDAVGRYRLPVLPLLVPLAVAGASLVRDWDRKRAGAPVVTERPTAPA